MTKHPEETGAAHGGAQHTSQIITTAEQVVELAKELSQHSVIAFDTEFIRENTFYPVVEIIQIATREKSWLVDVRAFKNPATRAKPEALKPLLEVFANPEILKVIHAAQGDQECLYTSLGVVAKPSIDTAVAASLCGYGDNMGLGNLLKAVVGITIKKGHARTNWSVRPLPEQLVEYAHADVDHLVELGEKLIAELETLNRKEWAFELSSYWENPKLYEPDPEGISERLARGGRLDKKGYHALIDLVKWRERRVRELNLPRRWVADDQVLMDLAHVRPKDLEHLGAFRGLNKGEVKNSGAELVAICQRAEEGPHPQVPRSERPDVANASESQVLDLMKAYIGILADQHRIAVRHLLSAQQLLPLLRSGAASASEWVERGLMSEGAAKLVGDEILAMLQGRRALSVQGRKVKVVELNGNS